MKRLIVVAIGDVAENTICFKVAPDNKKAFHIATEAKDNGFIVAVGAINYVESREKAYIQLRAALRKKVLEKVNSKI
jgi:CRISPR/Cas system-associated exonuclease Cas4 (RecB family)